MNRGDRREDIFLDDLDRRRFVATLAEASEKTGWQVHAFCLMGNHFHLVIETPAPNLVAGMKWMLGTYTQRFNARHRMRGHLFAGRYKALVVDESDDFYLRTVCDYVHLNPVRAGLLESETPLEGFQWSSYPAYLRPLRKRPGWLRVDRLLGEHGIRRDDGRGRREFARRMEARRAEEEDEELMKCIRRGWRFGSEDFLEWLGNRMQKASPERHAADQVRDQQRLNAAGLLERELGEEGIAMEDLPGLKKGHPKKVRIAKVLRRQTTLTLREIASLLHAGHWRSLANMISKMNK